MDKSIPSPSVPCLPQQFIKRHSSPFFHVVNPSHLWSSLLSCSRNSALHDHFIQTISFFSHHMTKVWWFPPFDQVQSRSYIGENEYQFLNYLYFRLISFVFGEQLDVKVLFCMNDISVCFCLNCLSLHITEDCGQIYGYGNMYLMNSFSFERFPSNYCCHGWYKCSSQQYFNKIANSYLSQVRLLVIFEKQVLFCMYQSYENENNQLFFHKS